MSEENHEVRELRFKAKQLAKCCGKQGETIHLLRAELAEVRELHSKIERNDIRRLERQTELLLEQLTRKNGIIDEQRQEITTLHEKLAVEHE